VSLVQSTSVSASTGEIEYILSGSSSNGSFYLEGSYKAGVSLAGLTLTNPSGAAIDIQNGKRIHLSVKRGTENTIVDGTSGVSDAWKGALQCKGHLEFKGYGSLTVTGKYNNAIWSKEYIEVKNCTIHVVGAANDAVNCNQYFLMESGVMNLSGFKGDGIQVSKKTTGGVVDTGAENTGNFTMTGGTINIDMSASSGAAVQYEGTKSVASGATLNTSWTTAVENTPAQETTARKIIQNGKVLIVRGEEIYDLLGNRL